MFSVCIICTNIVNPVGDIKVTICGHLFHEKCLMEWVNRSNTCPQCQKTITAGSMFPVYPQLSSNAGEDAVSLLQTCLDDAQMQINQYKAASKEKDEKLAEVTALLKQNEEKLSLYKVKVDMLEQRDEINKLKRENAALRQNVTTVNAQLTATIRRLRAKESEIIALTEQVRELPVFIQSIKSLEFENEAIKKLIQSMKSRLDTAREHIESQRARIVCLKEQVKMLPEPKNDEAIRLNGENKALLNNIQALDGILSFVKEKLARRETTISNLKNKVKRLENDKIEENVRIMKLWETLNKQKKETETSPALPNDANSLKKYLKREAGGTVNASGIPEKKTVKDYPDGTEKPSDSSSDSTDDCDSDASYDSDLELLDCYSHDPLRLHQAIIKKRNGDGSKQEEIAAAEPGNTAALEEITGSSPPALADTNDDKKIEMQEN